MYCPTCEKELGEKSRFCPYCGAKAEERLICQNCLTPLLPDMAFCPNCGMPVTQISNPPPEPAEIPESSGISMDSPHSEAPAACSSDRSTLILLGIITAVLPALAVAIIFFPRKPASLETDLAPNIQSRSTELPNASETSPLADTEHSAEESQEPSTEIIPETRGVPTEAAAGTQASSAPKSTGTASSFADADTREKQQSQVTSGTLLDTSHINDLLTASGAVCGGYILDVANMQEYNCENADLSLPASALIGVPIMFTIADGMTDGSLTPETSVTFHYTFENGRGIMTAQDEGKSYSIIQLLGTALLYSDNNALNSLIDFLTLERINSTCHAYGYTSVDMQQKLTPQKLSTDNYISAKDAVLMLNAIYQNNFAVIGESFLKEHFKMSGSAQLNNGIYGACGMSETFLNLNGITDSRYNEIALVKNPGVTFIICALTSEGNPSASAGALTNLASYTSTLLEQQQADTSVPSDDIVIYTDDSSVSDSDQSMASETGQPDYNTAGTVQDVTATPASDQDPSLLSLDLIQPVEGIYVRKPGLGFMQAPNGRMWQMLDLQFKYYTGVCPASTAAIDPTLVQVPSLNQGDELAIICSTTEYPVRIYPVVEDGYTIPVTFREDGIQNWGEYTLKGQIINDVIKDASDVNGEPYGDFFRTHAINTVDAFLSQSPDDVVSYSTDDHIIRAQKGEAFTLGYYEGTAYQTRTYYADYHYFAYDYMQKHEYPITLTQEGYGILDVSELANGFYLVQTFIGPQLAGFKEHYIIYIDR